MPDYYRDLAERVIATWAQAFIAALLIEWNSDSIDLSVVHTAALAGIPAALAVLKGAIAGLVGDPDTAALRRE